MKNIDRYKRRMKSQYGMNSSTPENLIVPLSDKAWNMLAELHKYSDMTLPVLIETLLETAYVADSWIDGECCCAGE